MINIGGHYYLDENMIGKKPIVMDVGAANGEFSFAFLSRFPSTTVWCLEPNLLAVINLIKKRQIMGLSTEACQILPIALAEKTNLRKFYCHDREERYLTDSDGFWHSPARKIKMITTVMAIGVGWLLDALKNQIDIMKIDVEGAEFEIIRGLSRTDHRPKQICMELHYHHPDNIDEKLDMDTMLEKMGYKIIYKRGNLERTAVIK